MNYKIFIFTLLFVLIPPEVFALEQIEVLCQKKDSSYECMVKGIFDYPVSAVDFHFSLPESAVLESYKLDSRWEGSADGNWASLYSLEDSVGEVPLLTLQIDAKKLDNKDIQIKDILVYDSEYNEHKFENNNEFDDNTHNNILLIFTICAIILIVGIVVLIIKLKGVSR